MLGMFLNRKPSRQARRQARKQARLEKKHSSVYEGKASQGHKKNRVETPLTQSKSRAESAYGKTVSRNAPGKKVSNLAKSRNATFKKTTRLSGVRRGIM